MFYKDRDYITLLDDNPQFTRGDTIYFSLELTPKIFGFSMNVSLCEAFPVNKPQVAKKLIVGGQSTDVTNVEIIKKSNFILRFSFKMVLFDTRKYNENDVDSQLLNDLERQLIRVECHANVVPIRN
ncbi:MAG: hypothetical protein MHPSP_002576 [Paramarteilia canceri]